MPACRAASSSSISRCEWSSIHSAASTARRRSRAVTLGCLLRLARDHLDKAAREELADLVEADVAAAICRRLRQLAEHHQFRQRRRGADLPGRRRRSPIASTSSGSRKNDRHSSPQTWSWVQVYSSPGWPISTDPATSSLNLAAAVQAKTAFAHIGDRVAAMQLRERLVARPRVAAEIGHRHGSALQKRGRTHAA